MSMSFPAFNILIFNELLHKRSNITVRVCHDIIEEIKFQNDSKTLMSRNALKIGIFITFGITLVIGH